MSYDILDVPDKVDRASIIPANASAAPPDKISVPFNIETPGILPDNINCVIRLALNELNPFINPAIET